MDAMTSYKKTDFYFGNSWISSGLGYEENSKVITCVFMNEGPDRLV